MPEKRFVRKEISGNIVNKGFRPGLETFKARGARVGANPETVRWQVERLYKGMGRMNYSKASPGRLLNITKLLLSIDELSTKKFGPKKQPALYEGPLYDGVPTGLQQDLRNIVGRVAKREAQGKAITITDGEINYLRKNLPNVIRRLESFLQQP